MQEHFLLKIDKRMDHRLGLNIDSVGLEETSPDSSVENHEGHFSIL